MAIVKIEVPDDRAQELLSYVGKIGGRVIGSPDGTVSGSDDDKEVTHEKFFGENIQRVIDAFRKS